MGAEKGRSALVPLFLVDLTDLQRRVQPPALRVIVERGTPRFRAKPLRLAPSAVHGTRISGQHPGEVQDEPRLGWLIRGTHGSRHAGCFLSLAPTESYRASTGWMLWSN
jgi:hypothetical protein